jgi:hypothetical protein
MDMNVLSLDKILAPKGLGVYFYFVLPTTNETMALLLVLGRCQYCSLLASIALEIQ